MRCLLSNVCVPLNARCTGVKQCEWQAVECESVRGLQNEGKGPANAEWQMPDRYIGIWPAAPRLPLRAWSHLEELQELNAHANTQRLVFVQHHVQQTEVTWHLQALLQIAFPF